MNNNKADAMLMTTSTMQRLSEISKAPFRAVGQVFGLSYTRGAGHIL